ncbi:hypothetical protein Atai01_43860 [Amycolatopsis taiwanensis]|uniref:Uncharacterized protein n=1 Tax=Amycolatopsis taiwanensis TaxID=342230 RepID=A0A9W6R563_9PSEU|nr:hypothetical protein [Amycolatopsis taiwanensis]GLY67767.1 hypothetical protein Atai01_43860 [Amycolatopsis taiwanensis]
MWSPLVRGALAGAAGTTALNAVTYLDMVLRGRPASSTPETSIDRLSAAVGVPIPGDEGHRPNRLSGLGALLAIFIGIAVGAGYGLARQLGWRPPLALGAASAGLAAMVGASAPMTVLGVTDPRTWRLADWVADVVPHLAYGVVTAATYRATE